MIQATLPLTVAWLVQPALLSPQQQLPAMVSTLRTARTSSPQLQADDFANDGAEVDWDQEAQKLGELARPMNPYYKAVSDIEASELIQQFASTAPDEVQFAIKTTVASLLGNMPSEVADSSITTTGKSLASLMFSMQMTGYMFRNAEYRRLLASSLDKTLGQADKGTTLPPVSGTLSIKIGSGMEAEVEASAYMTELRSEVEGLREQLANMKQEPGDGGEQALIQYIQNLDANDRQELSKDVSAEILEAMSQLVATILIDLNIDREMEMSVPTKNLRELLIWQLVSGYKLRELEVRDGLKDRFWGIDGESKA